ncbi:3-deoxy-manno-octulosonate cytidylyltransferase [Candidatus Ecksteinia adelgidicola]|nr:3-deoxy-manno-octulosonate cytidylyltransferase [Candidatus Ecksteinia adelgidicola]
MNSLVKIFIDLFITTIFLKKKPIFPYNKRKISMNFIVIIPARHASTRFPAKPLANINGKPMVVKVMMCALKSGASRVIVAVDHPEVAKVVKEAGGEICMTSSDHNSGTERIAEVIEKHKFFDNQIIVNLQGDEPMMPPFIIKKVVDNLYKNHTKMATLAVPINSDSEAKNINVVKVVVDSKGYALYFSRSVIPYHNQNLKIQKYMMNTLYLRHIGIYAYYAGFIRYYVRLKPSPLEKIELLEQLRALWYGENIYVTISKNIELISVDHVEDLKRIQNNFYSKK